MIMISMIMIVVIMITIITIIITIQHIIVGGWKMVMFGTGITTTSTMTRRPQEIG